MNDYDKKLQLLEEESKNIKKSNTKSNKKGRRTRRKRRKVIIDNDINMNNDEAGSSTNNNNNTDDDNTTTTESKVTTGRVSELDLDFYAILGVSKDESHINIIRAAKKLLIKYNPQNITDDMSDKKKKEYEVTYKLVSKANEILTDSRKRSAYDYERDRTNAPMIHESLQDSYKKFQKLQESSNTEENRKLAELDFEKEKLKMNAKHGYNPDVNGDALTEDEMNEKLDDLMMRRDQEDLKFMDETENLFEGRNFNPAEFNKMFERNSRRQRSTRGEIELANGISAFNDGDDDMTIGVDIGNNDLYDDNEFTGFGGNYAGINAGFMDMNINDFDDDDEIDNDINDPYSSYNTHNLGASKEDLDKRMNDLLSERKLMDKELEELDINERGHVMDDKFGISSNIGFVVGDSMFNDQVAGTIKMDEDDLDIYKQLTQ